MTELYKHHRPKRLKDIVGQPEAVKTLETYLKNGNLPHTIMLNGESGTGKTTIARILRRELKCDEHDLIQINCARERGIDMGRSISNQMWLDSTGPCRVWILDEFHKATSECMSSLLLPFEDTPKHVYFFICTTDMGKVLKAIQTRCTVIKLNPLSAKDMLGLLSNIASREGVDVSNAVLERITEVAEGSPRKALVILDQVIKMESEKDMLNAILNSDTKKQAIDLARKIMDPRGKWNEVAAILKEIKEDPETVRKIMCAYANSVLVGGGKLSGRAFLVGTMFGSMFYEPLALSTACYELYHNRENLKS